MAERQPRGTEGGEGDILNDLGEILAADQILDAIVRYERIHDAEQVEDRAEGDEASAKEGS